MDKDKLTRRYQLTNSASNYEALRREYLDFIVEQTNSISNPEVIRGMLLLIRESDKWTPAYIKAVEEVRKQKENERNE